MKKLTFEQWIEEYNPIMNPFTEDNPYDNTMFETFGNEIEHVVNHFNNINRKQVWTLIDAENEERWIVPGYLYVNRLGYFITEKEWESEDIEVNDNEMISIGKAKYLCKEFVEEELGILFTDEMEDKLHNYYSQL